MLTDLSEVYLRVRKGLNYRLWTFARRPVGRLRPTEPVSRSFPDPSGANARCVHCDIWKNRGKEYCPIARAVERHSRRPPALARAGPRGVHRRRGAAVPFAPELLAYGSSRGLRIEHLTHGYWRDQSRIESMARAARGE